MYNSGRDVWGQESRERRPEVTVQTIEKYDLYRTRPDFVYSVSREFIRNCPTCLSCLTTRSAHAYQTAIDVASLAPNADIAVYPWNDPPERKARTIHRVRKFLKAHLPVAAVVGSIAIPGRP
jgi:hypothetical protein